jgi:hypothetical protein
MRTLRLDRRLSRWLNVSLGGRLRAVTEDASSFGFCAVLDDAVFVPGSTVEGDIQVKDRVFRFRGKVSWAEPGSRLANRTSRIGVAFEQISDDFALLLHEPMRVLGAC